MIGGFHVLPPWSLYFCQYVGCADLAFFFFFLPDFVFDGVS